tara:strand:- start:1926 stop:2183 length:258 start_codon:yes stop_codon:yes gene_type:complete
MSLDLNWENKLDFSVSLSDKNSPLKDIIIEYVGNKLSPDNNDVTVEMVVQILAEEFPEVVFSLAEENWIRGYEQGLEDLKAIEEQ